MKQLTLLVICLLSLPAFAAKLPEEAETCVQGSAEALTIGPRIPAYGGAFYGHVGVWAGGIGQNSVGLWATGDGPDGVALRTQGTTVMDGDLVKPYTEGNLIRVYDKNTGRLVGEFEFEIVVEERR